MTHGLTSEQAHVLLNDYGYNVITSQKKSNLLKKLFEQFFSFFTLILLSAAILAFFIGEALDAVLIFSIVILNGLFGLYQEKKAEEAVAALKNMTIVRIRVLRDGQEIEIDSKYLVPGDVIFIEEGIKIPADGEIIESANLEINEASLTGESIPVVKAPGDESFMGTIVAKGRGRVLVRTTGMSTKFGQIAEKLANLEEGKTPLEKKLQQLSEVIGLIGILISLAIFGLSLIQGSSYFTSFLLAISLAVAIVPEGLPTVMTITLAIGVKEMAKRKSIVRKLSAIEALGNITLIATDKTGTLTTNNMEVKEVWIEGKNYEINNLPPLENFVFKKLVYDGILCSTASLVSVHDHGSFQILGDPTEGALLMLGKKVKVELESLRSEWKIIDEIPFDSVTKRMSVTVQKDKEVVTYMKGAPESILSVSKHIILNHKIHTLTDEKRAEIEKVLEQWARKGLRVLAFSYYENSKNFKKFQNDAVFLGLVAIHDPPRPEAKEAIARAHAAGIRVVMITGDNEKTAEAIGTTIGLLAEGDEILLGEQVEKYTDEELMQVLPKVRIFARTTPFHKSRIVSLYQKLGEVVAVTGDGVNDAIALKQADVGVAMGKVGTDVARETADMVITDDNFETIVNAVAEGRNIVKNLKNSIVYLLTGNLSEALTLMIGLILGFPHIFVPLQLLYINLLSDGIPALALAFSPRDEKAMLRKPEKQVQLLNTKDILYIVLVGLFASIIVTCTYLFMDGGEVERRTIAFSMIALIQAFIFIDMWLSHQPVHKHFQTFISKFFLIAFLSPIIGQFIIVNNDFLLKVFAINSVNNERFIWFVILSGIILVAIKMVKKVVRL